MSYTCILMVLCECACANIISKAKFNQIINTDLFICLHIMFQISFQHAKGEKGYRRFLGVPSELLLSIVLSPLLGEECIMSARWFCPFGVRDRCKPS